MIDRDRLARQKIFPTVELRTEPEQSPASEPLTTFEVDQKRAGDD